MSINLVSPIVPAMTLKMLSGKTRLIGIPKQRVQVIMSLPNINEFNDELNETIKLFKERAEAFIITSSSNVACHEVIKKYELQGNLISREFKEFSEIFNIKNKNKDLNKSLMIIDTNCQISHKTIL